MARGDPRLTTRPSSSSTPAIFTRTTPPRHPIHPLRCVLGSSARLRMQAMWAAAADPPGIQSRASAISTRTTTSLAVRSGIRVRRRERATRPAAEKADAEFCKPRSTVSGGNVFTASWTTSGGGVGGGERGEHEKARTAIHSECTKIGEKGDRRMSRRCEREGRSERRGAGGYSVRCMRVHCGSTSAAPQWRAAGMNNDMTLAYSARRASVVDVGRRCGLRAEAHTRQRAAFPSVQVASPSQDAGSTGAPPSMPDMTDDYIPAAEVISTRPGSTPLAQSSDNKPSDRIHPIPAASRYLAEESHHWFWQLILITIAWMHLHFHTPQRACDRLLRVIHNLFLSLALIKPVDKVPVTLTTTFKRLGLNEDFEICPICLQCRRAYPEQSPGDLMCSQCHIPLFDTPTLSTFTGQYLLGSSRPKSAPKPKPVLQAPYLPLSTQLVEFLNCDGNEAACESYLTRTPMPEKMQDIQDGDICQSLKGPEGRNFFDTASGRPDPEELRIGLCLGEDGQVILFGGLRIIDSVQIFLYSEQRLGNSHHWRGVVLCHWPSASSEAGYFHRINISNHLLHQISSS
ncbi:hypothetical protein B0H11DRAFT_2371923 [Mycena galericulata]|nr:hypothetical protein B0H11DRAFT_2371923 [Mycena galericulata]